MILMIGQIWESPSKLFRLYSIPNFTLKDRSENKHWASGLQPLNKQTNKQTNVCIATQTGSTRNKWPVYLVSDWEGRWREMICEPN